MQSIKRIAKTSSAQDAFTVKIFLSGGQELELAGVHEFSAMADFSGEICEYNIEFNNEYYADQPQPEFLFSLSMIAGFKFNRS